MEMGIGFIKKALLNQVTKKCATVKGHFIKVNNELFCLNYKMMQLQLKPWLKNVSFSLNR